MDAILKDKVNQALNVLHKECDPSRKYSLNFSGGKDSHVVLGLYTVAREQGLNIDCRVRFSDTGLESPSLYRTIAKAEAFCQQRGITFETVKSETSYWYWQFGRGYPVPTHFSRWCTGKLKVLPITKDKRTPITGRHLGESAARDKRLAKGTCGTNDCGVDKLKQTIDPIIEFRNCDVWDYLFYADGNNLYEGVFDNLTQQYEKSTNSKSGSLRMGCFMCPVISKRTLYKNYQDGIITREDYTVREILEELREARRIMSPRTKNKGAIYIEDRRTIWKKLDLDYLLKSNYISSAEIDKVEDMLAKGLYPKTYPAEWIEEQHRLLNTTP